MAVRVHICANSACVVSVLGSWPVRGCFQELRNRHGEQTACQLVYATKDLWQEYGMSMSDPLADMFTRLRNAAAARHESVRVPASNVKRAIADVMKDEGFVRDYTEEQDGPRQYINLRIMYDSDRKAVLNGIRRVSRPGLRVYVGKGEIPRVYGGLGVAVISTSDGVMSGREAWRRKVGGEVLCYVW